jgi:hypothetical protein
VPLARRLGVAIGVETHDDFSSSSVVARLLEATDPEWVGVVWDSHYVDLLRWCLGPPAEVTAVCTTQAHQIEVEDTALAIVRFASGAVGTILSSTAAWPGFPQRLEITGTEGTVTVEDGQIVRRALAGAAAPAPADTGLSGAADPAAVDVASHAAQLADLLDAVDFDPANFVQGGVRPFTEAYALLRPYLVYPQVKDALAATGEVVPAGQGDGELRRTLAALREDGFAGFMSLEPHLAEAGRFGGFSGPEGFRRAAAALKFLLNEASISWQ